MKKIALIGLIVIAAVISCKPKSGNYNKITINNKDSIKNVVVEITSTDTLIFEVPGSIPDSLILASVKETTDSLRKDSLRRDSLHQINFRRITRIINGGYNGYADRVAIWKRAKKVLSDTIN